MIKVENMTKKFGKNIIFQDVDFSLEQGEAIAILGKNGCGKSTFLKILSRIVKVDKGKITYERPLKINYIPENFPKLSLTPKSFVSHMGRLENLKKKEIEERSIKLFQRLYMEDKIDTPMQHLSKGTLQKVCVVQAFLSKPDILLMDEPLDGQDLDSIRVFMAMVDQLIQDGVALVLSCHEQYLAKSLAEKIYKVENKMLVEAPAESLSSGWDMLYFSRKRKRERLDAEVAEYVDKVTYQGDKMILIVREENSNFVIQKMLDNSYQLRRMENTYVY